MGHKKGRIFFEKNGFKNFMKTTEQTDQVIVTNARSPFFNNRTDFVNPPLRRDSLREQNEGEVEW